MVLDKIQQWNDIKKLTPEELRAAIEEDKTGEGFIYEMFLCELNDHEYGYTMDTEETLTALGYTTDEVLADARLRRGLEKATAAYFARNMRTGLR